MSESSNNYEHLRKIADVGQMKLVSVHKTVMVYDTPGESITLYLARYHEKWLYGYEIHLSDGREGMRPPDLEYGYFINEQDAILHFLGLLMSFRNMFSKEAVTAIKQMMSEKSQLSLW